MSSSALRRCGPDRSVVTLSGAALGTSWQVRVVASGGLVPIRLRWAIERRLAEIVAQMSQWEPNSRLSHFNAAPAGTWLALPADFVAVIGAALALAKRTGGAFDPTHGRAAALLGYGAVPVTRAPSDAELQEARASAGWQRLAFDAEAGRLCQPGGLWLDFSGIAKGYAVDMIADLLRAQGFEDALVEIGGELVGRGLKPDGQPWWVDLETPPGVTIPKLRVGLHEMAVATSGDYVRGAHTLDPRTGRPLESGVISVTVLHRQAMMADAWATALTVLGPADGLRMADAEGLAVRFVVREGNEVIETLSAALTTMVED